MWCEPEPITVSMKASAFKRMENLKFLIINNVQNSKKLKYLSNELRLFEWSGYHFSLPSKWCPQKLVGLKVSNSCIRSAKLFKQVWVYNLRIFTSLTLCLVWEEGEKKEEKLYLFNCLDNMREKKMY